MPFFLANPPTASNLLAFRPGQPVGNWRDSNQGTGYGPIPFDVNIALVPANLRAVGLLSAAGVLSLDNLGLVLGVNVMNMAEKWEALAPPMFEVSVDVDTAEARLQDFVEQVSLNEDLLGNSTSSATNVSFYALSLMADGTPVQVRYKAVHSQWTIKLISTFLGPELGFELQLDVWYQPYCCIPAASHRCSDTLSSRYLYTLIVYTSRTLTVNALHRAAHKYWNGSRKSGIRLQ